MAKWSGSKPGGPQSDKLIPLTERPPEEAKKIRSMGGKAAQKKRQQQKQLSEIARSVLAMGYYAGKVVDPDTLYTVEDVLEKNVPTQTRIVALEAKKCIEHGNIESRDWLFKVAFPDDERGQPSSGGNTPTPTPDEGDGVRIHLIRGEKPRQPGESEATLTANGAGGAGE